MMLIRTEGSGGFRTVAEVNLADGRVRVENEHQYIVDGDSTDHHRGSWLVGRSVYLDGYLITRPEYAAELASQVGKMVSQEDRSA